MAVCPNCGHENEDGAKFCSQCGSAFAARSGTERKVVTALFADLVGSWRGATFVAPPTSSAR